MTSSIQYSCEAKPKAADANVVVVEVVVEVELVVGKEVLEVVAAGASVVAGALSGAASRLN